MLILFMEFFFEKYILGWFILGNLLEEPNTAQVLGISLLILDRISLWIVRNLVIISAIYFILYNIVKKSTYARQITLRPPLSQVFREIKQGILSTFIAGLTIMIFTLIVLKYLPGSILLYDDINSHSYGYFLSSIFFLIIANEFYFYSFHRLLHTKWLFRKVHYIHHKSSETNPFSGFSFHPVEATILYIYPNLFFLALPVHQHALTIFFFFNIIFITLGHSGWEYIPKILRKKPWNNLLTNGFHHSMHHRKSDKNYGLYLNIFDHLLNTNYENYYRDLEDFNDENKYEL